MEHSRHLVIEKRQRLHNARCLHLRRCALEPRKCQFDLIDWPKPLSVERRAVGVVDGITDFRLFAGFHWHNKDYWIRGDYFVPKASISSEILVIDGVRLKLPNGKKVYRASIIHFLGYCVLTYRVWDHRVRHGIERKSFVFLGFEPR